MKQKICINAVLASVMEHYFVFRNEKWVGVHNANWMPIPWFGDLEAYSRSARRIVTVGLNPSQREFLSKKGLRFDADVLHSFAAAQSAADVDLNAYRKTLNLYFEAAPYKQWFSHFNKVLVNLQASFDKTQKSRALHIDLMTTLPTTPSWGGLDELNQKLISQNEIFKMLINALKPQLVIFVPGYLHLEAAGLTVGSRIGNTMVRKVSLDGVDLAVQRSQKRGPLFTDEDIAQIVYLAQDVFH